VGTLTSAFVIAADAADGVVAGAGSSRSPPSTSSILSCSTGAICPQASSLSLFVVSRRCHSALTVVLYRSCAAWISFWVCAEGDDEDDEEPDCLFHVDFAFHFFSMPTHSCSSPARWWAAQDSNSFQIVRTRRAGSIFVRFDCICE
jgi:hypothetical protein